MRIPQWGTLSICLLLCAAGACSRSVSLVHKLNKRGRAGHVRIEGVERRHYDHHVHTNTPVSKDIRPIPLFCLGCKNVPSAESETCTQVSSFKFRNNFANRQNDHTQYVPSVVYDNTEAITMTVEFLPDNETKMTDDVELRKR